VIDFYSLNSCPSDIPDLLCGLPNAFLEGFALQNRLLRLVSAVSFVH